MAESTFKKHDGSGVCDVCSAPVAPNEANLVPVDVFYGSAKYKAHLKNDPMFLMMGGGDTDGYLATMRNGPDRVLRRLRRLRLTLHLGRGPPILTQSIGHQCHVPPARVNQSTKS